mgnify:CR=1 FL=1
MPLHIALAHCDPASLNLLQRIIEEETEARILWTAADKTDVYRKSRLEKPDLLLIDLELADAGSRLICDIMKEAPCAILLLSDTMEKRAEKVFEAMGCGALDAIATPFSRKSGRVEGADALLKKIATLAKLLGKSESPLRKAAPDRGFPADRLPSLIAIGSSTGGPKALAAILSGLPETLEAAILVCQHVDLQFARGLAQWLDTQTPLSVSLAEEGARPRAGAVLVAATNDHLVLGRDGAIHYTSHPREYAYRPSVNAFFASLLQYWPRKDLAILLTGMGRDGAEGLAALRKAGWHTIVQDEKTSVVYGMPAAAVELGGAVEILPLGKIAAAILKKIPVCKGNGR